MNIKSTEKNYASNDFVNKCIKKLKNKDIDYKIRFIHLMIILLDIKQEQGQQVIDYAFYDNILKTDREVANDEIKVLEDLLGITCITREVNKATFEELERYNKITDLETEYLEMCQEDEERERKYNEILSKRYY